MQSHGKQPMRCENPMNAADLSDEQLAGQRIILGFNGTRLDDRLKYLIGTLKVGGIILFSRNIETPEQLRTLCGASQAYAKSCGQPPLFIAVDQEGGEVARLKPPFTQFPGNPKMRDLADADCFARITADELSGVHINMNMAPVLDVALDNTRSIMRGRAFGADPYWVAEMGTRVIRGLQQRKIMAVAKHFPGIGRTTLDSHQDLPELDIAPAPLMDSDLLPFKAAIAADVAAVMLSHIRYTRLDAKRPASFSPAIARDLLRRDLGYTGVVMTDDLDMGAVTRHFSLDAVLKELLDAQIDVALTCHESEKLQQTFDYFLNEIRRSDSRKAAFLTAVQRILKLKAAYF